MAPSANDARQARHDKCKRLVGCPSCGAKYDESCRTKDFVNPVGLKEAAYTAGMGMGKSVASTHVLTHRLIKLAYSKQHIGGLHRERWAALSDLDAIIRLAEIETE